MNRRTAIRKAFGFGAAAATLPVLATVTEAAGANTANQPLWSLPTPVEAYQPPPPDTRTPEELFADQEAESVRDTVRHLTSETNPWFRRYMYSVWPHEFNTTRAELRRQQLAFEERTIHGFPCLIGSNGNVVRMIAQPLYVYNGHTATV